MKFEQDANKLKAPTQFRSSNHCSSELFHLKNENYKKSRICNDLKTDLEFKNAEIFDLKARVRNLQIMLRNANAFRHKATLDVLETSSTSYSSKATLMHDDIDSILLEPFNLLGSITFSSYKDWERLVTNFWNLLVTSLDSIDFSERPTLKTLQNAKQKLLDHREAIAQGLKKMQYYNSYMIRMLIKKMNQLDEHQQKTALIQNVHDLIESKNTVGEYSQKTASKKFDSKYNQIYHDSKNVEPIDKEKYEIKCTQAENAKALVRLAMQTIKNLERELSEKNKSIHNFPSKFPQLNNWNVVKIPSIKIQFQKKFSKLSNHTLLSPGFILTKFNAVKIFESSQVKFYSVIKSYINWKSSSNFQKISRKFNSKLHYDLSKVTRTLTQIEAKKTFACFTNSSYNHFNVNGIIVNNNNLIKSMMLSLPSTELSTKPPTNFTSNQYMFSLPNQKIKWNFDKLYMDLKPLKTDEIEYRKSELARNLVSVGPNCIFKLEMHKLSYVSILKFFIVPKIFKKTIKTQIYSQSRTNLTIQKINLSKSKTVSEVVEFSNQCCNTKLFSRNFMKKHNRQFKLTKKTLLRNKTVKTHNYDILAVIEELLSKKFKCDVYKSNLIEIHDDLIYPVSNNQITVFKNKKSLESKTKLKSFEEKLHQIYLAEKTYPKSVDYTDYNSKAFREKNSHHILEANRNIEEEKQREMQEKQQSNRFWKNIPGVNFENRKESDRKKKEKSNTQLEQLDTEFQNILQDTKNVLVSKEETRLTDLPLNYIYCDDLYNNLKTIWNNNNNTID